MLRAIRRLAKLALLLPLGLAWAQVRGGGVARDVSRIDLAANWHIQSSAKLRQSGAALSARGFDTSGWYPASVPSTVLAALVANGVYPDPYFGMNLRALPGVAGDIGDNFSNLPMPPDSPFAVPWWYRTEFRLPPFEPLHHRGAASKRYFLHFDSINYRANVWLNGRLVAAADRIRGMYRTFEIDITEAAVAGTNVLAVEVFAPTENDLTITFVDWNPLPPDKDMGIVRGVYVTASGPVTVRHSQVVTRLNNTLDEARLSLFTDLRNAGSTAVEGTLTAATGSIAVSRRVRLEAGQVGRFGFAPEEFRELIVHDPELWWPYGLGPQNLHELRMEFAIGGVVSNRESVVFGIREFTSELDERQHRLFRVNGRRILIRGAGWTHDMMLRVDPERQENEIRMARDMHLNTLRLEGKMLDEHFFETADRLGMLVMPGWCCCSYWEQWDRWTPDDYYVAGESLRDQLRLLRNHASVFVFLYSSDIEPNPEGERLYLRVLQEESWPHPYLAAARDSNTPVSGRTGVKMTGPYDYVPPIYWYEDTARGGAWGFNTETSAGHAIPVLASLREMLPAGHLWPVDEFWNFHAASPSYPDIEVYNRALETRYGAARGLEDYVRKSQVMAYENERAMFEAYGRNKYVATGVIQWMLNNAWPSIVWHLYDYYLRPGGGYFGTKKANEPVHVQYSYDDGSIVVVNSTYQALAGYRVTAKVYNFDLTEKFSQTVTVDLPADSSTRAFYLPAITGLSRTYFVRLTLSDAAGAPVSSNFYWLSTQKDAVDYGAQVDYRYTPIRTYADLTDLEKLPPARVTARWTSVDAGADRIERIVVENPSDRLAFAVHLTVVRPDGSDLAPVFWEDNYFELFPGERREIEARYARKLLGGGESRIQVDGWNLVP